MLPRGEDMRVSCRGRCVCASRVQNNQGNWDLIGRSDRSDVTCNRGFEVARKVGGVVVVRIDKCFNRSGGGVVLELGISTAVGHFVVRTAIMSTEWTSFFGFRGVTYTDGVKHVAIASAEVAGGE
jgi:hypothetical protein